MIRTPVALIFYKRPHTTERVFAEIARAQPSKLLLIADGPKAPEDEEKCRATRAIVERVDWNCEVLKNYSETNLGCGQRPYTGISWVFEQVPEAIILEDDCVPHPTFFPYCEELLARYGDDERVMQVSGQNFLYGPRSRYSYFFSRYPLCGGGWASWRRAWRHVDMRLEQWPELRDTPWLLDVHGDPRGVAYWRNIFDRAHAAGANADYWDYQWMFTCWAQSGLATLPGVMLLSNIGYGADATHTGAHDDPRSSLPMAAMNFPLRHPPYVVRDLAQDRAFFDYEVAPVRRQSTLARLRELAADHMPAALRRPLPSVVRKLKL